MQLPNNVRLYGKPLVPRVMAQSIEVARRATTREWVDQVPLPPEALAANPKLQSTASNGAEPHRWDQPMPKATARARALGNTHTVAVLER